MQDADWVVLVTSVAALLIGAGGLVRASHANEVAGKALALAASAEARADRMERIQTESRDVRWRATNHQDRTGRLRIQNFGSDVAERVRVTVEPIEDRADLRTEIVGIVRPLEHVQFDLMDLLLKAHGGQFTSMSAHMGFAVDVRIAWRSPSGVESVAELKQVQLH